MKDPWFWSSSRKTDPALRLFCFPYAGGDGIPVFRLWPSLFPPEIEVLALRLPGRGGRITEPLNIRLPQLLEPLQHAIRPYLDRPAAFFGYSMGALIAFELARTLQREQGITLAHLALAARRPPQEHFLDRITYHLPTSEFIAEIQKHDGIPQEALKDPEMLELILPILRADLELCQTSGYAEREPLGCPMMVFGGERDEVSRDSLLLWREHTKGSFALHMFPGNHFFIRTAEREMIALLSSALRHRRRYSSEE